jgi:hypothetical protein
MRAPDPHISQAMAASAKGERFGIYGISDVPYDVLARAQRLWVRYGRLPHYYLFDWCRFTQEKQR